MTPLQVNPRSVKFVVPPGLEPGIFACRVDMGGKVSDLFYLNAPLPWWQQGDWGAEASPGGWMRVFGRCLSLGGATVALVQEGQKARLLKPNREDMWSLTAEIPAATAPGEYTVWVHNGKGGPAGWANVAQEAAKVWGEIRNAVAPLINLLFMPLFRYAKAVLPYVFAALILVVRAVGLVVKAFSRLAQALIPASDATQQTADQMVGNLEMYYPMPGRLTSAGVEARF